VIGGIKVSVPNAYDLRRLQDLLAFNLSLTTSILSTTSLPFSDRRSFIKNHVFNRSINPKDSNAELTMCLPCHLLDLTRYSTIKDDLPPPTYHRSKFQDLLS
jgi:hypothetical protein